MAELDLVGTLYTTWDELVLKSKNIDASLISVKKKFTEVRILRIKQSRTLYFDRVVNAQIRTVIMYI